MSVLGGLVDRDGSLAAMGRRLEASARWALATLMRPPRSHVPWPSPGRIAMGAVIAAVAIWLTVVQFDMPLLHAGRRLPTMVIDAFNDFTDFGRSSWFLWPTGLLLLLLVLLDSPALPRFSRGIYAAFSVRLGFVFTAVALPGLFVTIIKRLIGRARPFVAGDDPWTSMLFVWRPEYASFPSGHATTAFSALVAIGALFPAARALMWTYAVLIAVSRIVIGAHHPSDVLAGAIAGALGALLVRNWFAERRLGFAVGADGVVRPMPGPSLGRIAKAVAHRLHGA